MNKGIKSLLVISLLFYCLDYFFRISPSLVLVPMMQQYHIDTLGAGALQSAFYFGYLIFLMPAGILLDHFRIHTILQSMIIICCLCFIGFCYASTFEIGLCLRFITGLASGISFVAVLSIASRYYPQHFNIISGLAIGLGTLSASLMQSISATIMNQLNWHILYLVISGLGLLLLIPLANRCKENNELYRVNSFHLRSLVTHVAEYFKDPRLILNAVVGGLFYLPTSLYAGLWGISFMEYRFHISSSGAASGIFLLFLGWAVGSPIIGILADRYKNFSRIPLIMSLIAACLSLAIIQIFMSTWVLFIVLFIFGLVSSAQVGVWKYYHQLKKDNYGGLGIALTNMIIMFFGACFHSVVGYFIDIKGQDFSQYSTKQLMEHFQSGLMIIPVSLLLASVLIVVLNYLIQRNANRVHTVTKEAYETNI